MSDARAIDAVLFDLDGTLLDTAPDFAQCLNDMLSARNAPALSMVQMRPWVSEGGKGMVQHAFDLSEEHPHFQDLLTEFLARYEALLGKFTVPFPGMMKLLDTLEQKAIRWGIVTNKPTRFALPLLEKFKLRDRADCLVCGDTLSTKKPDPAPLQHACDHLKLSPQTCLFVGDAYNDAQASVRAGIPYVLAHYGYIPPKANLSDWSIYKIIYHPDEILSLLP